MPRNCTKKKPEEHPRYKDVYKGTARHWCFTYYPPHMRTPPILDEPTIQVGEFPNFDKNVRFCIYQLEITKTKRKLHFQGYIQFISPVRYREVLKYYPNCHVERQFADNIQARNYCMKTDETKLEGPWQYGEFTKERERVDLNNVRKAIEQGATMKEIAQSHFGPWVAHHKAFEKYAQMIKRDTGEPLYRLDQFTIDPLVFNGHKRCHLIIGGAGTGKSAFACAHFKHPLVVNDTDDLRLLDSSHDGIVFDDMTFSHWPVQAVINLLDRQKTRSIHCRYENATIPAGLPMVFTCNKGVNPFYNSQDSRISNDLRTAVNRRLHVCEVNEDIRKEHEEEDTDYIPNLDVLCFNPDERSTQVNHQDDPRMFVR